MWDLTQHVPAAFLRHSHHDPGWPQESWDSMGLWDGTGIGSGMCFIPSGHSTSACSAGIYWVRARLGMSVLPPPMLGEDVLVVKSSYRT